MVLKFILVLSKRETGGLSLKRKRNKIKQIYDSGPPPFFFVISNFVHS